MTSPPGSRRLALARSLSRILPPALALAFAAAPSIAGADMPPDDTSPPIITITAPKNMTVFEAPASFIVSVSASDIGTGVAQVELKVDGAAVGEPDTTTPFAFNVDELAAGSHTIEATATDLMGNSASASVTIEVEAGGESSSGTDTGSGGEPAPGCGCSHAPGDGGLVLGLGVVLLGLGLRRRR